MRKIILVVALSLPLGACSSAQLQAVEAAAKSDFHTVASLLLALVTAAQRNPALLAEARAVAQFLVDKADPSAHDEAFSALSYVNQGDAAAAQAVLAALVAGSAQ